MIADLTTSDWTDIAVAGATLTLALITVFLGWQTRRTAQASVRAVDAAEANAKAANRAAAAAMTQNWELAASRIDARSPLVVPYPIEPPWPPLKHNPNEVTSNEPHDHTAEFRMPADGTQGIWFSYQVVLRNEGSVSALLWGLGKAHFIDVKTIDGRVWDLDPSRKKFVIPTPLGSGRFVLPPDRYAVLRCVGGAPVSRWVAAAESNDADSPKSKHRQNLIVGTQFDEGPVDNITIVLQARPLQKVPDLEGTWRLSERPPDETQLPLAVVVEPIQRRRWASRVENEQL